jgi:predicted kinase
MSVRGFYVWFRTWYNGFMKRKPIVYIICGFIGAGKTTFAKKLEKKTGAVRITKDEWSISLIGNDPTIARYDEWDAKIIELSRDVAFHLVEKGIDVIIDEGFWEKEQRAKMKERIEALGAKEVLYYLDTPIETIRERVVGRNINLTKESFKISREMLDNYLKCWQAPSEDEDYSLASEVE